MFINILIYLIFTVSGLVLLKMGAGNTNIHFDKLMLNLSMNIYMLLGLICYILSFVMYTILLKKYSLSYIVPITTSLSYVAVLVCSVLIFKEKITLMSGTAVVIILVGVVMLNLSK